ncbi:type II toxin-antitoxin system VapC family toxin [Desulfococcaceae bacterium HSG8]|nr:type II toxin-antitoxin system VapC family toxin [Desulfococcaceae bacterium HSG8]
MSFMLDTCILIHIIRDKNINIIEMLRKKTQSEVCVSLVTVAEMEYGAAKSSRPDENRDALYQFLSPLTILTFDQKAAYEYGLIRSYLEQKGMPIGSMDMMIAAHARSISATIVTDNVREFDRVPGLTVENWLKK